MAQPRRPLIVFFQDTELTHSLQTGLSAFSDTQRLSRLDHLLPLVRQAQPTVVVFAKNPLDWDVFRRLIKLQSEGLPIGVVVLARTYSFEDESLAFAEGADHYLLAASPTESITVRLKALAHKVIHQRILIQNSKNQLPQKQEQVQVSIDGHVIHIQQQHVRIDNQSLRISPIQTDLLKLFLMHEGVLFSRQELHRLIWKGQKISPRSIDAQISKLKQALPLLKDCLTNSYGQGYLFDRSSLRKSA